ncbi:MAG: ATP-binding cassette domain-containing protein, partial [Candidatus Aegiribacteria sp.]|nr:ATP-binding cassette domain-containing protein [Candidatus Aegiribacteria sp.]
MNNGFILKNLTVNCGDNCLLKNITMNIPSGRILLVAGESGSGKSSLGRLLTGLIPQQYPAVINGSIQLDEENILDKTPEYLAGTIAHVASEPWSRFFQITVRDELAFGPRNLGWSQERTESSVNKAAEMLGLTPLLHSRVDTMSGGQLQKLSIGAALAMESSWLILDEPSSYLDLTSLHQLISLLVEIHERRHLGIVLLEHRIGEFAPIADDVAILNCAELVFHGSREDFGERADSLCDSYGLRHPDIHDPVQWNDIITDEVQPVDSDALLKVENLSFSYGSKRVLEALNLTVYPAEILAVAGSNGSGKTTLGRIAAGLLKPDNGIIRLSGEKKSSVDGRLAGMLFQNPASMLFSGNVKEELLSGPDNYRIDLKESELDVIVESMSLGGLIQRHPQRLSRGQRLRVAIAAVLILNPRLIILDEPIRGQDWRSLSRMMGYIKNYVKITNSACILITHE